MNPEHNIAIFLSRLVAKQEHDVELPSYVGNPENFQSGMESGNGMYDYLWCNTWVPNTIQLSYMIVVMYPINSP